MLSLDTNPASTSDRLMYPQELEQGLPSKRPSLYEGHIDHVGS